MYSHRLQQLNIHSTQININNEQLPAVSMATGLKM